MKLERLKAGMTYIMLPAKLHISKYMWLMFFFYLFIFQVFIKAMYQ